jgi:hypothetical protein
MFGLALLRGRELRRGVLDKGASSSRSVVIVWSEVSVQSEFVKDEAEEGRHRKVLVPIRIDGARPPLGFRGTHFCDLVGWDGTPSAPPFQRLVKDLSKLLGEPPYPPAPQEKPPQPRAHVLAWKTTMVLVPVAIVSSLLTVQLMRWKATGWADPSATPTATSEDV